MTQYCPYSCASIALQGINRALGPTQFLWKDRHWVPVIYPVEFADWIEQTKNLINMAFDAKNMAGLAAAACSVRFCVADTCRQAGRVFGRYVNSSVVKVLLYIYTFICKGQW